MDSANINFAHNLHFGTAIAHSSTGVNTAVSNDNPDARQFQLRHLWAWMGLGNSAERKAARDRKDLIDRLTKMSPHLLDDIGIALDLNASATVQTSLTGAADAVAPVTFYFSERFATK